MDTVSTPLLLTLEKNIAEGFWIARVSLPGLAGHLAEARSIDGDQAALSAKIGALIKLALVTEGGPGPMARLAELATDHVSGAALCPQDEALFTTRTL